MDCIEGQSTELVDGTNQVMLELSSRMVMKAIGTIHLELSDWMMKSMVIRQRRRDQVGRVHKW